MLPARPRLRASFFFEGDAIACELTLMDEQRALVHRQRVPVLPGSGLEQVHAGLLSLVATLAGVSTQAPPAPSEPQMSEEELQIERARRAELQGMGWHPSVLRVLPGDPVPMAPLLSAEELQSERERRAALQVSAAAAAADDVNALAVDPETLIENHEPPPTEPPPRLTSEELDAERERRARGQTQPLRGGDVVIENSEQE